MKLLKWSVLQRYFYMQIFQSYISLKWVEVLVRQAGLKQFWNFEPCPVGHGLKFSKRNGLKKPNQQMFIIQYKIKQVCICRLDPVILPIWCILPISSNLKQIKQVSPFELFVKFRLSFNNSWKLCNMAL